MEENMAANTFGTVIHDSLEALYRPYLEKFLEPSDLDDMVKKVPQEVEFQWSQTYSPRASRTGKNYLSFEMAKEFILKFIRKEKAEINKGSRIKVLALEKPVSCVHRAPGIDFEIRLRGTIDRIDEVNGVRRIVDYKTGKVAQSDMNVRDWEKLISEERYSKAFQVLMYAYMYAAGDSGAIPLSEGFESGIFSFRNLKTGFMKVNSSPISQSVLDEFVNQLDALLSVMFDPKLDFEEKELPVINY
jgi:ATP-dependent exoDNAse (exonuclease V) beta subunit